jgi:lipopolysaccharide/colanic/teichoic acid biosynthesis glycosyltransferase
VKHEGFADAVAPERRVGVRRICIRIADIAIAGLCLALLAPLLILVVIIVRFNSPGSLLVRQWRYGYRNRPIFIRKFRTTFAAGKEAVFLTLVSTLLIQTGIEDLPMLANVLRGEMSIFGPAPSVRPDVALNDRKPGFTRWAEMINSDSGSE